MARKPEEVEAAIELARAAGVSEALLERMGGYTGCVGVLDTGRPGPVTTLRFDIDCLAIEETKDENHLPNREGFASTRPGLSHACGHDGHIGCDAKPGQVGVSHEGYLATTKFDLEIFGLPCAAGSPEKGHSALMCACNTVMALGSLPGHSKGITRVQVGKIVSGTARNIVAGHAYVVLEVRGESTEINDYMAANVETTVKGLAAAYECTYKLTRMGEAVTYKGDEEAVELVKAAARDAEGVTLVTDMNAKVGSEDCTMLIRRIQAHGGKCAFFYFGCDHHGHHRPDFEIQDRTSLPVGWGVFTGFVARTNAR